MTVNLHPHDPSLEQTAISMLMARPENLNKLDKHCFYVEELKKTYEAMKSTNSTDLSVISIEAWVDLNYLYDITYDLVSKNSDEYIIKEMIRYKDSRTVMRWIYKLEAQTKSLDITWAKETLQKLAEVIDILDEEETLEEQVISYFESFEKDNKFLPSWIEEIDKYCLFKWWQLIIVAGRPWMWKTTVMLNMAIRQAAQHNVGFVSLEMSLWDIFDRFICMLSWLTSYEIQDKKSSLWKITEYLDKLLSKKLFMSDKVFSLEKIEQFIVKNSLDVCYIDYLGLIMYGWANIRTIDRISEITRRLKMIALKNNVKIVLWSQMSRQSEHRADNRPVLADLRDSGSIEQDADMVLMLYREDYYDKETDRKNILDILVRKNRWWMEAEIPLGIDLSRYRLYDQEKPF